MESGVILDQQISASSSYGYAYSARNGRLNFTPVRGRAGGVVITISRHCSVVSSGFAENNEGDRHSDSREIWVQPLDYEIQTTIWR